jgi:ABC-type glycerol-3-phosphate transport system substrate-binding protein
MPSFFQNIYLISFRGEKMSKQIWKCVWLMAVLSMVLAACGSASPATSANANAPITVWIDQPRQPAIDAFIKANPADASLIKGCGRRP